MSLADVRRDPRGPHERNMDSEHAAAIRRAQPDRWQIILPAKRLHVSSPNVNYSRQRRGAAPVRDLIELEKLRGRPIASGLRAPESSRHRQRPTLSVAELLSQNRFLASTTGESGKGQSSTIARELFRKVQTDRPARR